MEEGSDGSGNDGMELGGGSNESWNVVKGGKAKRKRKNNRGQRGLGIASEETDSEQAREDEEEHKVISRLEQEGTSFGEWNPVHLTKAINKQVGDVKSARVLHNGALLIFCRDSAQLGRAIRVDKIEGKKVVVTLARKGGGITRGVIFGVPLSVSIDQIIENVKGAKVREAKRLKTTCEGEKCDSLSVLVTFDEERLPERVHIGYMSYGVRLYVPRPLRCFKCQKYGHVAAVCKGRQRCGKCAGEHEYGKCEIGAKIKCCNCGGEHTSAYRGCEVSKRAAEVQQMKTLHGITYAEAARRVRVQATESNARTTERQEVRAHEGCKRIKEDTMVVGKRDFILFMVEVVNCTAQTDKKTEKIKIIVRAAEKYLGLEAVGWEEVEDLLKRGGSSSQNPSQQSSVWDGGSSWS
ncbi:uncharacterized protein LOC113119923 [Xyrichtys novacula]|uniref:Uncharacterized protein LOC113119923 n=1 Tax=Xyrichtys novacula TaxID=13765 RepID=A0AAV1FYT5_XYRNO|nr:uncharacterized protein LOC113119923 [Xyrichtys novacula]